MRQAFLIAAFASMVQARSPVIWTETGMERVGPTDAARENKTAELFAARGEYEPFQVVVQAGGRGLHDVTFRIGDLSGPAGHFISRANLTVYREHYVRVEHGSPVPKNMRRPPLGPRWYADALIPEAPYADDARLPGSVAGELRLQFVHEGNGIYIHAGGHRPRLCIGTFGEG